LGKIPQHWGTKRLKFVADIKTGNTPPKSDLENYCDDGLPWIKPDDLGSFLPIMDSKERLSDKGCEHARIIPEKSVLICCIGSVGKVGVAGCKVATNQQINSLVFRSKLNPDYALYLIAASEKEHQRLANGNVVQIINSDTQGNILLSIPPFDEQRAIASFLDRETDRIDTLVAKKERQIELLQEKRATLIGHAVTKGLNLNAKMKDSGIEWFGDIPEHWHVIRVKSLEGNRSSAVQTGPFGAQLHANDYMDEGVPLILIRNVGEMRINNTNIPMISYEDAERLSIYRIKKGDIVFSRVGSIGRIAPCTEREEGWLISGQMLRLRILNPRLHDRFAAYAFGSSTLLTFVELHSVGSTRESINTEILRNMPVPIPTFDEQRAIAAFLDRETERIGALICKVKDSIEKLREYRTALISAAVTGKIDIRKEVDT
jgi:restriction endonuclease S subunit